MTTTLTFRGHQYETASAIAPSQSEFAGKYRGIPTTFSSARPSSISTVQLTYRGVSYLR
ncbi:MAG: DUF4278 domain-containing protein [Oscillatoriales cyanobacterium C42_A2020_001]|nr:DUF4278 domain-containing protein [Leptolyngbyaceae cyanobacterium C42_A2020_001]